MVFSLFGIPSVQLNAWRLGAITRRLEALVNDPHCQSQLAQPNAFERPWGLYSLSVTLKMFLTQCLSDDHTCRTAVATAKDRGWLPPHASPDTGAYCRARDGLSPTGLDMLVAHSGTALDQDAHAQERWMGRQVRVVDGTGITLPDTPQNQVEYPQPTQQKPGCGFPVLKLVVLMSLATGAVLHYVSGSLHHHDLRLFDALRAFLSPGDVVLGDRAFGTFATIALLIQQGVDAVFRCHHGRKTDLKSATRLGKNDYLVTWQATPKRPAWLDPNIELPETLLVREVTFQVTRAGFRTKIITVVTTLLDAKRYPPCALAELYLRRWVIELWLRDIKTTMGMEMLRTKTPKRVRSELAMFLLGYNLIRTVMHDAICIASVPLGRLSFKSAAVRLRLWWARTSHRAKGLGWLDDYKMLLKDLIRDLNPCRVGRVEPRVKKRRPKPFPLMTRPRQQLRQALLQS